MPFCLCVCVCVCVLFVALRSAVRCRPVLVISGNREQTVVGNSVLDSSWNVMAHGDAREGNWRGNWRIEWVARTLNTTTEHGVSSITTADAHTSAATSRLNWRPRRFKSTRPFWSLRLCHHISNAFYRGWEWVGLYLYSPFMPPWRRQGKLHL